MFVLTVKYEFSASTHFGEPGSENYSGKNLLDSFNHAQTTAGSQLSPSPNQTSTIANTTFANCEEPCQLAEHGKQNFLYFVINISNSACYVYKYCYVTDIKITTTNMTCLRNSYTDCTPSTNVTLSAANDENLERKQSTWYGRLSAEKKAEYLEKRRIARQKKKATALPTSDQGKQITNGLHINDYLHCQVSMVN